jgi:tetratricopeptide (TPR) repeat protein
VQLALEGVGERQFIVQFMQLAKAPENNPFATHLLADYYSQGGNGAEAKALYILLANQSAYVGKPLVLNNLANIYIDEGKLDTAFNYAEQAYNALPGNQAILDTYGWVASLQGKHEFALDLLRSSFAMNASDPEVRYHIAITLHKLNRNEEALDEIAILLSDFADFKYRNDAIALQQQIQNEAALR